MQCTHRNRPYLHFAIFFFYFAFLDRKNVKKRNKQILIFWRDRCGFKSRHVFCVIFMRQEHSHVLADSVALVCFANVAVRLQNNVEGKEVRQASLNIQMHFPSFAMRCVYSLCICGYVICVYVCIYALNEYEQLLERWREWGGNEMRAFNVHIIHTKRR